MNWTTIFSPLVSVRNSEVSKPGKRADHSKNIKNKSAPNSGMKNAQKSKSNSEYKFNHEISVWDGVDENEVPSDELLKFMDATLNSNKSIPGNGRKKTRIPDSPRSPRDSNMEKKKSIFSPNPKKSIEVLKNAWREKISASEGLRGRDVDQVEESTDKHVKFADVRTKDDAKKADSKPQDLPADSGPAQASKGADDAGNKRTRLDEKDRHVNKPDARGTTISRRKRNKNESTLKSSPKTSDFREIASDPDSLKSENAGVLQKSQSVRELTKKYSKKLLRQVTTRIDRIQAGIGGVSDSEISPTVDSTRIRVYPHAKSMIRGQSSSSTDSIVNLGAEDMTSTKVSEILDDSELSAAGRDRAIDGYLDGLKATSSEVDRDSSTNDKSAEALKEMMAMAEDLEKSFAELPVEYSGKGDFDAAPEGLEAIAQELRKEAEEMVRLPSKPKSKGGRQNYLRAMQKQRDEARLKTKIYMNEVDKMLAEADEILRAEAGERNDPGKATSGRK